uniref:hypothetical protein n=1 Tax=Enterocloster clostridioformis TaxID=1531 RepID=UPI0026E9DFD3|nr:hypothetical protein [Enterocloster clostridioformis]
MEELTTNMEETAPAQPAEIKWYKSVSYEDAKVFIKSNITSAARSFIAIGYYLKLVRDKEMYREDGHETIWDFAKTEYGISQSTASRYMSMNDRFSKEGNSPIIRDEYKEFGKSQLQEMLSLTDEQMERVSPSDRVEDIRNMRKPKEIPYVHIPGQVELTDFPGVEPEDVAASVQAREEIASRQPEKQTYTISAEDLLTEPVQQELEQPVAISQQKELISEPQSAVAQEAEKSGEAGSLPEKSGKCIHRGECNMECHSSERRPAPQLSAYGTPRREYPADSLIATEGCEGGHDCFSCSMECEIRQAERRCVGASCGNPFPCEILMNLDGIREQIGENCEFVNYELAYHRAGDGEPSPCCKHCKNPCEYICEWAMRVLDQEPQQPAAKEQQNEEICCENENQEETAEAENEPSDVDLLRGMLEKEKEFLDEMIKVDKVEPLPPKLLRKKKILVAALAGMLCNLEEPEPEEAKQPALPVMKNNDQRKAWLRDYQSWGLWYTDEHIGARYYKYDFENGARLIVEEYSNYNKFTGKDYTSSYLHLVGGSEPTKHPMYGCGKWNRHETYDRYPDSETELVEFLKEIQKKKKDDGV